MAQNLPKLMKAVGLYKYLPITDLNSLQDLQVEVPALLTNEVLVEVRATAVNPIDTKQRAPKQQVETKPRILGWDGSGVVVAKGENASLFKIGDEVFFTGDIRRNGSNAQYVALDQILLGTKPKTLTFAQAAALPLTAVTAYEALFERLALTEKDIGKTLLIINSAGGVGSIASQLAKNFGLKVIGTASRPETMAFSKSCGADLVLNHTTDLLPQLEANGYVNGVDLILMNYDPFPYWDTLAKAIKAQGKICLIVDSSGLVDLAPLKDKSVTLAFEMMLTRIKYNTDDKFNHHEILEEVSRLVDEGKLAHTLTRTLSPINAANLREAHRLMEEKRMIGKLVLTGF
ncbi:Alcohol dehydrogenase [Operophtera brumata]|uniref:Alcohol dehydrogenase n=1 Tax=Operophtera brumata TaxID=104452 RepID=A0A0L7LRE5_OPEBR|nr:Alcohol dehydrogenase [Operophtera brumata]